MPPRAPRSAGLLVYRRDAGGEVEVLVVHPGGPYWARKDAGSWSLPKGEIDVGEEPLAAARREFGEELGLPAPAGPALPLGTAVQAGGKRVIAWAVDGDVDVDAVTSATVELEWPPRSGVRRAFPEVDRAAWCTLPAARTRLVPGQVAFLDRLERLLGHDPAPGAASGTGGLPQPRPEP